MGGNSIDDTKNIVMVGMGTSKVLLRISINGMCVDVLAPTMNIKRGSTFHLMAAMMLKSGWYLSSFLHCFCREFVNIICELNEFDCKAWI